IFEHSHDVMLRNDVVQALERHDAAAARAAHNPLAQEGPAAESRPALGGLLDGLERADGRSFADHASLKQARQAVEAKNPLAERIFGAPAALHWLAAHSESAG